MNSLSQSVAPTQNNEDSSIGFSSLFASIESGARISQQSEIGSSGPYMVNDDGDIILQRTIYNNLKSLVKNTNVEITENGFGNGYEQFLIDMSLLHDNIILQKGHELPPGIDKVNIYLGSLGSSEDYPIERDKIVLLKFLNADYKHFTIGA